MSLDHKFREAGFSLVQVMVAVGLMGGLALAMMKMTDNQLKQQKTMELKAEQGDVANVLRQAINNKVACEATFIGMSPGDNIPSLRMTADMSQPAFAETGVKFKNSNVYIKSMYLLTRAEELSSNQRPAGMQPISDYTTGFGQGYLRVTFVKNVGVVADANVSHNFYGAKETSTTFQVNGYFYDYEMVKHSDETKLDQACWDKANANGMNCAATPGRCRVAKLNEDANPAETDFIMVGGVKVYLAECFYYKDDSPFMGCASP